MERISGGYAISFRSKLSLHREKLAMEGAKVSAHTHQSVCCLRNVHASLNKNNSHQEYTNTCLTKVYKTVKIIRRFSPGLSN